MPQDIAALAEATHHQGAKIALICEGAVVAYLRDDFAHIPNPGEWDLPGGVREEGETALACALRETHEEFGIHVPPAAVTYAATYTARNPLREVAFFAAQIEQDLVATIVYGDEGQGWRMMPTRAFIARDDAVQELRDCLADYLADHSGS